jgi:hypothetical protein
MFQMGQCTDPEVPGSLKSPLSFQQLTCSICAASTWLSTSAIAMAAPPKQVVRPSATCAGSCHVACFQAWKARSLVFLEVGLGAVGQNDTPCGPERRTRLVEGLGHAARVL